MNVQYFSGEKAGRKKFVVDSSSLITISDNCFIKVIKHLADREKIDFLIPESVYAESVVNPLKIKRFELSAVRIRDAIEEGYLKIVKSTQQTKKMLEEIQHVSGGLCLCNGNPLKLLHWGESETLALLKELNASALVIDERTTRMLIEEPENLINFLRKRHKCNIEINRGELDFFKKDFSGTKVFRSVELIALAYEDGSLENEIHKSRQALEAALYAAKFAGCAVSFEEIGNYVKRVKN